MKQCSSSASLSGFFPQMCDYVMPSVRWGMYPNVKEASSVPASSCEVSVSSIWCYTSRIAEYMYVNLSISVSAIPPLPWKKFSSRLTWKCTYNPKRLKTIHHQIYFNSHITLCAFYFLGVQEGVVQASSFHSVLFINRKKVFFGKHQKFYKPINTDKQLDLYSQIKELTSLIPSYIIAQSQLESGGVQIKISK